jgi:1,4-alpha-glucan branching enzyme
VVRTFELPATVGAARVALVGDFNGWDPEAHPMARAGDRFTVTVELEPGRTYRYRYLLDGRRWENDWAADAYAPNGFGSDDSVART